MKVLLRKLSKRFGSSVAVDRLSLEIDPGEFVVLLGPSGCGKTTTLRMVAGLDQPDSGDIFIADHRVNDVPPGKRDIAMVFQNYALYPHMTVAENIAYPLRVRKEPREGIQARVSRVADNLEIGGLLARRPRELSGGERQRVALARAIIREPQVFLMDEPLSNLDARLRAQMRAELKHLQAQLGTTTVYVTHDQAEAMTLAHRVAVMKDGRLLQFDAPVTLYNEPADIFVARFVGSPGMNLIEGRIDRLSRRFESSGFSLHLSQEQLALAAGRDLVTLGIRPEHLSVRTDPADGWTPACVYVAEMMGNETLIHLEAGDGRITARGPAELRVNPGERIWFACDPRRLKLFDSKTGSAIRGGKDS